MIQPQLKGKIFQTPRARHDPFPGMTTFLSLERDMAHTFSHFSPTAAEAESTSMAQSKDKWPDFPEPEYVSSYYGIKYSTYYLIFVG